MSATSFTDIKRILLDLIDEDHSAPSLSSTQLNSDNSTNFLQKLAKPQHNFKPYEVNDPLSHEL